MASTGPPYPWEPPVHLRPPFFPPRRRSVLIGRYACAFMWFWVLYRSKQDGDVVLGLRYPWEHKGEKHNVFPRSVEELTAIFAPASSSATAVAAAEE